MPDSIRLMFEYRDGQFVPLEPEKVDMVAPHEPVTRGEPASGGRFVELRSEGGEVVSAHRVAGAGPPRVEFPTGDEKEPFGHAEPPPGSLLSVVVEDDERATHAALVEARPPGTRGLEEGLSSRDLAVVPLPRGDSQ